jgi:DNA-binding transcriptional regulator YdaS (Cro superfamily)
MEWDDGLRKAVEISGGARQLAEKLGIAAGSIYGWRRVPAERVPQVSDATGLSPHTLRPDLYRQSAA